MRMGGSFGEGVGNGVAAVGVGASGEQAGPGGGDVVRGAGAVVGMLEGAEAELRDPGDSEAVAAEEVVQVGEGGVEGGAVGLEAVGDEEQEGLVAGVGVGAPVVVGQGEGVAVAAGVGAGDEVGGGGLRGLLDGDGRPWRWAGRLVAEGVGPEAEGGYVVPRRGR